MLYESKNASPFVRDLIELVLGHMLIVEPLGSLTSRQDEPGSKVSRQITSDEVNQDEPKNKVLRRITSDEVKDRLARMLDSHAEDPYYAASKNRVKFKPPSRRGIQLHTTGEKLRDYILTRHARVRAMLEAEKS